MKILVRFFISLSLLCVARAASGADLSLDSCLRMAENHYPVIRKYGIIDKTYEIEFSNISKQWLPQASVYMQGSIQNSVPQLPEALRGMMQQAGQQFRGLGKEQYKAGVDLTQTIWDGGASKSSREAARTRLAEQRAALDVEMYQLRDKVESIYFSILLIEQQCEQIRATITLLDSSLDRMKSWRKNGIATQSDVDITEAQRLAAGQQLASAQGEAAKYRNLLEVFIGETLGNRILIRPDGTMPQDISSNRPELHLFNSQIAGNNSRLSAIKASLMPRIGLFAQAYYGYPGLDYFAAMRSRNMSFNILAGLKVSWSVSSLYRRSNDTNRITLANQLVEADRDKFLFETSLATSRELSEINTLRDVMADDEKIISLRANVRKAAESQLRNGVIDATALLQKITDEQQARLTASYHDIQLLRLIYQLKNTINR